MPPQKKDIVPSKASKSTIVISSHISQSSLIRIPEDAVSGFEERFMHDIRWNDQELAYQRHKSDFYVEAEPKSFNEGLLDKLRKSSFGSYLDDKMSPQEIFDLYNAEKWDIEQNGSPEEVLCHHIANDFIFDINELLQLGSKFGKERFLKRLYMVKFLRLIGQKVTFMDKEILKFKNICVLNLGCNCLTENDFKYLPETLKILELNGNKIREIMPLLKQLPPKVCYLGLSRNLMNDDTNFECLNESRINVLDLSDNDITDLKMFLDAIVEAKGIVGLCLSGNPCSVSAAYAFYTRHKLRHLLWLDNLELYPDIDSYTDLASPNIANFDIDEQSNMKKQLSATYFEFKILSISDVPEPPTLEQGITLTYHIELELPLLDGLRRQFLMTRRNESLILPVPEPSSHSVSEPNSDHTVVSSSTHVEDEDSYKVFSDEDDPSSELGIYKNLKTVKEIGELNYTIHKSNEIPWSNVMMFQDPLLKILCPDMRMLRETCRTELCIRLICTVSTTQKTDKNMPRANKEMTIALIKCQMIQPVWTENWAHFKWTSEAEDGRAVFIPEEPPIPATRNSVPAPEKVVSSKEEVEVGAEASLHETIIDEVIEPPIVAYFGYSIETLPII